MKFLPSYSQAKSPMPWLELVPSYVLQTEHSLRMELAKSGCGQAKNFALARTLCFPPKHKVLDRTLGGAYFYWWCSVVCGLVGSCAHIY